MSNRQRFGCSKGLFQGIILLVFTIKDW